MGWKDLFGTDRYSRIDNNYNDYDKKYKSGWSATSSWTSKIPNFGGFKTFNFKDSANNLGDALDDALAVLCNSISLFNPTAKIQWSFDASSNSANNLIVNKFVRDVNKFKSPQDRDDKTNAILLNPELIINNAEDSTALTQAYDALIGDAIMGGQYMRRIASMGNAKEFACVYAVLTGRTLFMTGNGNGTMSVFDGTGKDESMGGGDTTIIFSKTEFAVKAAGNSTYGGVTPLTASYTFANPFDRKFGAMMKFNLSRKSCLDAVNLFSALEQKVAEIVITGNFRGASSYIFASHKVASPDNFRKMLRTKLAKTKPAQGVNFTSVVVDALIWNLINQNNKIYGNAFTKSLLEFVEKELLPTFNDLPDVSLAKCVYIVKFITDAFSGADVFEEEYKPENNQGANDSDSDSDEDKETLQTSKGSDSGEGEESEGNESEGSGSESGEGEESEGAGSESGIGSDSVESQYEGGASGEQDAGEIEVNAEQDSDGNSGEGDATVEAEKPRYSHDDARGDNWNKNIRKIKLPLTAKDYLNDLQNNLTDEFDYKAASQYQKVRTTAGVSPSLSPYINSKLQNTSIRCSGMDSPIAVDDSTAVKAVQFSGARRMNVRRIIGNVKENMKAYSKIENMHSRYIDMIRERLRVRSIGIKGEEYSKYDGVLDEGNIWQLYDKNNDQIFMQENQPKVVEKAHISVLIDASGSMSGTRINMARELGVILSSALRNVHGVTLSLYGHSCSTIYNFNNKPDLNSVEDIVSMPADGGTMEGEAIQYVVREADRHRNENERNDGERTNYYVFVLGDGASNVSEIGKAMRLAQESGIKVCHLGIDNAYNADYGDKAYGAGRYAILPSQSVIATMVTAITRVLTL